MGTRIVQCVIFILLGLFPRSGLCAIEREGIGEKKRGVVKGEEKKVVEREGIWISSSEKDITTPIPTVPRMNIPSSSSATPVPVVNPAVSNPESPATSNPVMSGPSTNTSTSTSTASSSSGSSCCVASPSAPEIALQVAVTMLLMLLMHSTPTITRTHFQVEQC